MGLMSNCNYYHQPLDAHDTDLQRIAKTLHQSLSELGYGASNSEVEIVAIFILECMSSSSRNYHNVDHIFDIWNGSTDPLLIISGIFHDIVYYHVDGKISNEQMKYLNGVFDEASLEQRKYALCQKECENDLLLSLVMKIFGFSPGEHLCPFGGGNEFLSAVITTRILEKSFDMRWNDLASIAVCIEATIPFRKKDDAGNGPMDHLYQRLLKLNNIYEMKMCEEDIVEAIQRATELANRDVMSFSFSNCSEFLGVSWKLIIESNACLKKKDLYTISEYETALTKMMKFFSILDPYDVFRSFQDFPKKKALESMKNQAIRNLTISQKYLRAKLAGIAVLGSLAQLTGGDAPLSLFVSKIQEIHTLNEALHDPYLPPPIKNEGIVMDDEVFELLTIGRSGYCSFDIPNSPIAAYIYGELGDEGVNHIMKHSERPMTDEIANDILSELPSEILASIIDGISKSATTRAGKLLTIRAEFG